MVNNAVAQLVSYAQKHGLIMPEDRTWAINSILEVLQLDSFEMPALTDENRPLNEILDELTQDAYFRGIIKSDTVLNRDLLDTALMGRLTPPPREVISKFRELNDMSPELATHWYYQFSQDTNYIRRDRMAKDVRWKTATEYGELDITINLAKPEKDPRDIAASKTAAVGYPKCQLCCENEGYAGRLDHPARENHRVIPITVDGMPWVMQYSPYVYYNEHCIVLNREHIPMRIDEACLRKLLCFVTDFPHYFVGSNADLPIVGGSILSHDHFQGGRYEFAMEKASVETSIVFPGFSDVACGTVKWPMPVIRLRSGDRERLAALAGKILSAWRGYTDEAAFIFAETEGVKHNTITPIARRRGSDFELDLVLRNNITTEEYPLGVFHPHPELHHIKKENIGLIEVMGLAVLPSRLKAELAAVAEAIVEGKDLREDKLTAPHADWAEEIMTRRSVTRENVDSVLRDEVGAVFAKVLEHAGVFKRNAEGKAAFMRFIENVK